MKKPVTLARRVMLGVGASLAIFGAWRIYSQAAHSITLTDMIALASGLILAAISALRNVQWSVLTDYARQVAVTLDGHVREAEGHLDSDGVDLVVDGISMSLHFSTARFGDRRIAVVVHKVTAATGSRIRLTIHRDGWRSMIKGAFGVSELKTGYKAFDTSTDLVGNAHEAEMLTAESREAISALFAFDEVSKVHISDGVIEVTTSLSARAPTWMKKADATPLVKAAPAIVKAIAKVATALPAGIVGTKQIASGSEGGSVAVPALGNTQVRARQ